VQSSPISAVSPITTPMPWSMNTRRPMVAPGWISMPVSQRPMCEVKRASHFHSMRHSRLRQTVDEHGVKARISGDDFEGRARGRVAVEYDGDVFLELAEQFHALEDAIS
jgi:hypothetical protein